MTTVVVGASGGIGNALARAIAASGEAVIATGRSKRPEPADQMNCAILDATDESAVEDFFKHIPSIDRVIVATGFLHSDQRGPEKRLRQFDQDFFAQNIAANTIPAMLVAKHAQKVLLKSPKPVFAALSARVGSISDNQLGGWYSYRASKAALNMLIRCLAIEWQRLVPESIVVSLHPGTVDTALSAPFQGNVNPEKLFSPEFSAERLLSVLNGLTADSSGRHFAWDGTEVPA